MGCCISKCRPDKHSLQQHHELFNHVQDKLVISQQAPPTPLIPYHSSNKISPSPPSPTSSTSSISSFTCTTTTTSNTLSSTSSLSTASSSLSSKDRSFSNEFLWSCYKDNPHIIHINSLKEATSHSLMPSKPKAQYTNININPSSPKPSLAPMMKKLSPPQKVVVGTVPMSQKRVRSNSPINLTRQKSFRKEHADGPNIPSRMLGSPSPSRRFVTPGNGDKRASVSKRTVSGTKVGEAYYSHGVSSSLRNGSFNAASANNTSRLLHNGLRLRETCTYRVGSKIDETVVNNVLSSNHDVDSAMMEDIDNPLISLDCFIFL